MRYLVPLIIGISFFISSCGITSKVGKKVKTEGIPKPVGQKIEHGVASWYGPNFHGKLTANGETYDMHGLTAAHRTLPFNTIVKVKNLDNGKTVEVRINDRGPYAKDRIIDLSKKAARKIGMLNSGTAQVELFLIEGDLKNSRITNIKIPTYTVQLASYKTEGQAFAHSQQIRGSRVEKIEMAEGTVFRVYYGTYEDKDKARKKQRELSRMGYKGYVKQIQN